MFNIVLVNPQIPNNTGSIGRLCVNTGCTLHIIKPIGFDISEKAVRRAGLDYWKQLEPIVWEDSMAFFEAVPYASNFHFATTKTTQPYFETVFKEGDYLFFGSETAGISHHILKKYENECMTIPMSKEGRSLNLAVSVGIVTYEAIRQNFESFKALM